MLQVPKRRYFIYNDVRRYNIFLHEQCRTSNHNTIYLKTTKMKQLEAIKKYFLRIAKVIRLTFVHIALSVLY